MLKSIDLETLLKDVREAQHWAQTVMEGAR